MASTAARAYLSVGVLAVGIHAALGGNNWLYVGIGITSGAAILIATAVHRPVAWRAWAGIGVSQLLFAAGDVVYNIYPNAESPSWADALYLPADALLIVSMGLLIASSGRLSDLGANLDAGLLALIAGVCGGTFFVSAAIADGSLGAQLVSVAYPVADLVLLALIVRAFFMRGVRSTSYWLLLAAVVPLFLADAGEVIPAITASYQEGGWLDSGWLLSYVLFAVAAIHPSMGRLVVPLKKEDTTLPVRRALVLGIGLVAVPTSMILQHTSGTSTEGVGTEVAALLIAVGVVLRGAFLVRELDRMRRKAVQSERRFRMVFERAPIGISIGRNGIMSETNPTYQAMLGFTGSELAQKHHLEVTHPDDRYSAQQAELDSGSSDAVAIDKRLVRKDGSVVDAHVYVALDLEDGLGIGLIEDVTGRRELEEQLRQAQKMDSIGKLAGGIAHDFNNLMTAVIGYSDLMLQDPETTEAGQLRLDAIRDSAVRASQLTRQLLAFSRQQVLEAQDVDLREVVSRMDTLLQRLIGDDVSLQALLGSEPVMVRADKTQLEQVVMNLAVNARDAMPDGGTLTIAVLSDGGGAVLAVSDTGIGMDDDIADRIFEPFFTTKPLSEASGLGLSTVHGIVGQSGGTIQVESELGKGTVFTIRLPGAAVDPEQPQLLVGAGAATLVD